VNSYILILIGAGIGVGMVMLGRQLAAIHELVNSNLTEAQTNLALALARNRSLEQHIADEESSK
jgi:hypothetical protein